MAGWMEGETENERKSVRKCICFGMYLASQHGVFQVDYGGRNMTLCCVCVALFAMF